MVIFLSQSVQGDSGQKSCICSRAARWLTVTGVLAIFVPPWIDTSPIFPWQTKPYRIFASKCKYFEGRPVPFSSSGEARLNFVTDDAKWWCTIPSLGILWVLNMPPSTPSLLAPVNRTLSSIKSPPPQLLTPGWKPRPPLPKASFHHRRLLMCNPKHSLAQLSCQLMLHFPRSAVEWFCLISPVCVCKVYVAFEMECGARVIRGGHSPAPHSNLMFSLFRDEIQKIHPLHSLQSNFGSYLTVSHT